MQKEQHGHNAFLMEVMSTLGPVRVLLSYLFGMILVFEHGVEVAPVWGVLLHLGGPYMMPPVDDVQMMVSGLS